LRASSNGRGSNYCTRQKAMSLPSTPRWPADDAGVPRVDGRESFGNLVDKLSQFVPAPKSTAPQITQFRFFEHHITIPHTFEDFRRSQQGRTLQPLIFYLSNHVDHPGIVSALVYVHLEQQPHVDVLTNV
jgi:hypothetical protein